MKQLCNQVQIEENLYCLGPAFLPVYLLDGDEPVLFDAGMSFLGAYYVSAIQNILGKRSPHYLLLSHMHFDHCGAAGYLKEIYPKMDICASAEGAEIIQKPSALKLIAELSRFGHGEEPQEFSPFTVDRVLVDGETLHLANGERIEAISSPGHTRDMLSFYLPERRVMFPSEAAGVPAANDYIYSEFLVDYDAYLHSLNQLAAYEFDTLLFAHNYFYTDEDARTFFTKAIQQANLFKDRILELSEQYNADPEPICRIIKQEEYDVISDPKQPEPAYLINLKAKINAVNKWRIDHPKN